MRTLVQRTADRLLGLVAPKAEVRAACSYGGVCRCPCGETAYRWIYCDGYPRRCVSVGNPYCGSC